MHERFLLLILILLAMSEPKLNRSRNPSDYDLFDTDFLSRFVTDTGKIQPRSITGLSALHQRRITKAIKRSRNMLLMK